MHKYFMDLLMRRKRVLFEQLIGVSGVGGNTALTILSSILADDLYAAIQNEDVATLKRVKGIGAKTAGRIILELKDKIQIDGELSLSGSTSATCCSSKQRRSLKCFNESWIPQKSNDEKNRRDIEKTW